MFVSGTIGYTFTELQYTFKIRVSTVAEIGRELCYAIWFYPKDIYLLESNKDDWKKTIKDFFQIGNIPQCFGAVDGKHIRCTQ